ncbi:MAG: sigma factor-like helix-turn-helix DNA-binding protein [Candidatus Curtissbacteria bacterium]|nr:sigma factor-like helix-turn-helix DNA-binding protein [Candidatus Curtissbacteria bacterium]
MSERNPPGQKSIKPFYDPSPEAIAAALATEKLLSLDQPVTVNGEAIEEGWGAIIQDNTQNVEDEAMVNALKSQIRTTLSTILSPREFGIISLRFGIADGNTHTLEEIGRIYNVTRERIRQIEARAMSKLRASKDLREWYRDYCQF